MQGMVKLLMLLGSCDWADNQIELTDVDECLITFEKKKP